MKLVWHIMKKDLRRFWPLPLAVMLFALVLGFWMTGDIGFWSRGVSLLSVPGIIALVVLWIATIAMVVQCDRAADASSFWLTRPIAPWRMFGAKLAGVFAIGAVLPTAVFGGGLYAYGFPGRAVWTGTWLGLVTAGTLAVGVAAVAAATRTLGRFTLTIVTGVVITWVAVVTLGSMLGAEFAAFLGRTFVPLTVAALVTSLAMLGWVLAARTVSRCVVGCAGIFVAVWLVGGWGPWRVPDRALAAARLAAPGEWALTVQPGLRVRTHRSGDFGRADRIVGEFSLPPEARAGVVVGRWKGTIRWSDGQASLAEDTGVWRSCGKAAAIGALLKPAVKLLPRSVLESGLSVAYPVGANGISVDRNGDPRTYPLSLSYAWRANAEPVGFSGQVLVAKAEYKVLAEFPVVPGAGFRGAGEFFRVMGLRKDNMDWSSRSARHVIRVRTRSMVGLAAGDYTVNRSTVVLVHRKLGQAWVLSRSVGSGFFWLGLTTQTLDYPLPAEACDASGEALPAWLADATLVLVQEIQHEVVKVPVAFDIPREALGPG